MAYPYSRDSFHNRTFYVFQLLFEGRCKAGARLYTIDPEQHISNTSHFYRRIEIASHGVTINKEDAYFFLSFSRFECDIRSSLLKLPSCISLSTFFILSSIRAIISLFSIYNTVMLTFNFLTVYKL